MIPMIGYKNATTVSNPKLDRIRPASNTTADANLRSRVCAASQSVKPLADVSMVVKIAAATTAAMQ